MMMKNIYEQCPIYETETFIIRLIEERDAENLLKCYSDLNARPFFNSDACWGDFFMKTIEEMRGTIKAWIGCFERQEFIRFSIIDKKTEVAVGTIEMFGKVGVYEVNRGILRVDLLSEYETEPYLSEIFSLSIAKFFDDFGVDMVATKAISMATTRIMALEKCGFSPYEFPEREHYYSCSK